MFSYKIKLIFFISIISSSFIKTDSLYVNLRNKYLNFTNKNNDSVISNTNKNNNSVISNKPTKSLFELGLTINDLNKITNKLNRFPTEKELENYAFLNNRRPGYLNIFLSTMQDCCYENINNTIGNIVQYGIPILYSIYIINKIIDDSGLSYKKKKKNNGYQFLVENINENFDNVAGNHEAKESFQNIIKYLNDPESYSHLGAKPTKGILLTGAPGTGKTLLARALAGEAKSSFLYADGSNFNVIWMGSGTQKVKELFEEANELSENGPCIIFIDEIDSLAQKRNDFSSSTIDQTVNALLTELDGFNKETKHPIIFIAATNHPQLLDPAFLRPGRIDKIINIPNPNLEDRIEILKVHLNKIKVQSDINIKVIAQRTTGFTGADLANLINNAAQIAMKKNKMQVEQEDLEAAFDQEILGVVSKQPLSDYERKITAYHEAGHALINILLKPKGTLHKITIVPYGNTLGTTHFLPNEEISKIYTKEDFLNDICIRLGGRAAEEIIFKTITTSPYSDLSSATNIACNMVRYYGMDEDLLVETNRNNLSNDNIQSAANKILHKQYDKTISLLTDNIDKLHRLAHALLEKETLYNQDLIDLKII